MAETENQFNSLNEFKEIKSEVFVIQGIKIEEDELNFLNIKLEDSHADDAFSIPSVDSVDFMGQNEKVNTLNKNCNLRAELEEIKSDSPDLQGIKIEEEEITFENEIKGEEMDYKEKEIWVEEIINCDEKYPNSISEDKLQIIIEIDAQMARIPNIDFMNATKIDTEKEIVKHTVFGTSVTEDIFLNANSKVGQIYFKKCVIAEGENVQASSGGIDDASNHRRSINGKLKSYPCSDCESCFNWKYQVVDHAASVHGKEKPFKCADCEYSFSEIGRLTSHIKTVHLKLKPFKCTECDSLFCGKGDLTRHVRYVHRKEKPLKCLECEFCCSKKPQLMNHIVAVHRKLKPYKCAECYSCFSYKHHLTKHIMSVHRRIKSFICNECAYACSVKQTLLNHVKSVHRIEKPFKCAECDYSCSLKGNLTKHIRSIHKKNCI